MPGATAYAEVTCSTAAHLRGQAIHPGELAFQPADPRRQAPRGRLERIVHTSSKLASIAIAQCVEQWLDLAWRHAWPARLVHRRRRKALGRAHHDDVECSEASDRFN